MIYNKIVYFPITNDCLNIFQIIINKSGPLDRLLLKVEQRDTIPPLSRDDLQEILEAELKDSLQISVQVIVEAPNTLPRFEGKARRIIDNRS